MPIGRDQPVDETAAVDPVAEAQLNLIASAATDPQDLLDEEADPVLAKPPIPPPHPAENTRQQSK